MADRAWVAFLAVVAAGVLAIAAVGALRSSPAAYEPGPDPVTLAAQLRAGQRVCAPEVISPISFSRVKLQVGSYRRRGPALALAVRAGGRTLARGRLAAGYPDVSRPVIALDRSVEKDRRLRLCVRDAGRRRVALYGSLGTTVGGSHPRTAEAALTVTLLGERRSELASLPGVLARAATFKGAFVSDALLWVVALLVLLGLPALLMRAIALAGRDDG